MLKALLVLVFDASIKPPAWLNYLIVTISVSLLGWVYHSLISFRVPLTKSTLRRYVEQAAALKTLDYVLYNIFVYLIGLTLVLSVLIAGGVVFVMRVTIYMKYVFVPPDQEQVSIARGKK